MSVYHSQPAQQQPQQKHYLNGQQKYLICLYLNYHDEILKNEIMYHLANHFIANVKPASLSSKRTNMNNKPAINLNITDFKSSIRPFNYSCIIYLQENIERVNTKLCYKPMDGFAFAQKKAKIIMKEQCIIISQCKKKKTR